MRRPRLPPVAGHAIVRNAAALYGVTLASLAIPLVTLPYVARTLEPSSFGSLVQGQAFALALATLCGYAFGLTAVRDVARVRADPDALGGVAAGVLAAAGLLAAAALALALPAAVLVPAFAEEPRLALFAWLTAAAQGLSPIWYFQGVERLRPVALLTLCLQLGAAAGTLLLVDDPGDAWVVLALQAAVAMTGTAILLRRMGREVGRVRPRLRHGAQALRRGFTLFASTAAVTAYTTINAFVLGLFAPAAQVAHYGGAERMTNAAVSLLAPVSDAVFPRMSYLLSRSATDRARRLALLTGAAQLSLALAATAAIELLAPVAVRLLLGPGYEPAVGVLRVLALMLPVVALGNVVAHQWMLPAGLDRAYTAVITSVGAAHLLVLLLVAAPSGPLAVAWLAVGAETAVLAGTALASRRSWSH